MNCPSCKETVLDAIGAGRIFQKTRLLKCQRCGQVFDALAEAGRSGGRQRKSYSPEERLRRAARLAEVRALRWSGKA